MIPSLAEIVLASWVLNALSAIGTTRDAEMSGHGFIAGFGVPG
jgi:hypothetical protein